MSEPLRRSEATTAEIRVHYYQITFGPAHLARVRALDSVPGFRCRGVALSSSEQTRQFRSSPSDAALVEAVMEGVYEHISTPMRMRAAIAHFARTCPDAIIIDSPADPVQWVLGRWAHWHGCLVFSRWAATVLDHPRYAWKEWLKRLAYRGWDGYLVTGSRGLDYLRTFGVPSDRATLCGNPVDTDRFVRESPATDEQPRRIDAFLFVGRFLSLKNLPDFVRAFLRYRSNGGSFSLRLAGFGEDEPELRKLANETSAIQFLGHLQIEDLIREYRRCAALVLPSYSENWGLVVNEAMHSRLPVLASRHVGSVPELVDDGESGLLFDPHSIDSMEAALHRFERLSVEERIRIADRAFERAAEHTPEEWGRRVAEHIRSRVDRSKRGRRS